MEPAVSELTANHAKNSLASWKRPDECLYLGSLSKTLCRVYQLESRCQKLEDHDIRSKTLTRKRRYGNRTKDMQGRHDTLWRVCQDQYRVKSISVSEISSRSTSSKLRRASLGRCNCEAGGLVFTYCRNSLKLCCWSQRMIRGILTS